MKQISEIDYNGVEERNISMLGSFLKMMIKRKPPIIQQKKESIEEEGKNNGKLFRNIFRIEVNNFKKEDKCRKDTRTKKEEVIVEKGKKFEENEIIEKCQKNL